MGIQGLFVSDCVLQPRLATVGTNSTGTPSNTQTANDIHDPHNKADYGPCQSHECIPHIPVFLLIIRGATALLVAAVKR